MVIFNFDVALACYYCLCSIFFHSLNFLTPAEAFATSTLPVAASPCLTATLWF